MAQYIVSLCEYISPLLWSNNNRSIRVTREDSREYCHYNWKEWSKEKTFRHLASFCFFPLSQSLSPNCLKFGPHARSDRCERFSCFSWRHAQCTNYSALLSPYQPIPKSFVRWISKLQGMDKNNKPSREQVQSWELTWTKNNRTDLPFMIAVM